MGYKGFIQLALRSGQFQTISATPVYEGQLVEENPLT
nr:MAG TPA: RecT protein [Caudoviricetes sp.]